MLSLNNTRVLHQHDACAEKEAGGTLSRAAADLLGPEMAAVKAGRDGGTLEDEVFYLPEPHRTVRVRGDGGEPYQLVCDGQKVGEIDPYQLLREAPRNGIYLHRGRRYRVLEVTPSRKEVRLVLEPRPHSTTSMVKTTIFMRRLPTARRHGRVVVGVARIDVRDYLLAVTEKHINGTTLNTFKNPGGMPSPKLPTEGTVLRLEQPLWDEVVGTLGAAPAQAALEAVARLFGSLFPTVAGPCDPSDYAATADFPRANPPAVYLYDMIPYGVGLAAGASDHMAELVNRAAEQVRACPCEADDGCFRCVKNPRAERPASKAVTAALLSTLAAELNVPGVVVAAADADAPDPPAAGAGCPTCGEQPLKPHWKACPNCGTKREAAP